MGGMGLYYSQLLFQHKILNEFHVVVFVLASYIQPILHLQSIIKKYLISPIDVPIPEDRLEAHIKQSKEDYLVLLKQVEKLRKSIDLHHKRENIRSSALESKLLFFEENLVYFTKQKKQIGIVEFCQTTVQDCYLWAQWILVQVISFPLVIFRFFNFISYLLMQAQSEIFGTE
ncbi:hypothetical protein HDV04_003910 [Boothiomyces sp. JEL0838]|nr:hypothetical protein HDV04_003910 [Boothiomyces sp. JEL0838]